MAEADVPSQERLTKKSLMDSEGVRDLLDIFFVAQYPQSARVPHVANRHPILGVQVHAAHVDDLQ
jgi:hypothetical protein